MSYDIAAKVVVAHAKETLLRWFAQLDPEQVDLLEELPQETATLRRSDFPLWISTRDGQERIVVLEFQTRWKGDVPLRLAEYVIRYRLKYDVPAQGVVVVFHRHPEIPDEYEDDVLRFRYGVVRLWEMDAREFLDSGELGMYPFIPLMACEESDVLEAAERLYQSDLSRSVKSDYLTAMTFFSGLRGEGLAERLLRERRDIMSESFVYDIIKREGWQEGHREGHREGLQQGLLEEAHSMVFQAVRVKFGQVPSDVESQVNRIESRLMLVALHEHAIRSETLAQFREALQRELDA